MPKKSYRQAINEALRQEMERDHRVIVMGEDVAGGLGAPGEDDAWGGPLGVTKGLMAEFGRDRVLDTPITESAFIGAAAGAAATGLRPVAELMFVDFMGVCFDQIFNQAAKFRYMFGGKAVTPLVIRTMYGAGFRAASQHSQCLYPLFTHIPGLKVVLPSQRLRGQGPADPGDPRRRPGDLLRAQGHVRRGGRGPGRGLRDPVRRGQRHPRGRRRHHRRLRPDGELRQRGRRQAGARRASPARWSTRAPPRRSTPRPSSRRVEETGRVVVVDEAHPRCNMATDISALVASEAFEQAQGADRSMVTAPHAPVPFSPALEDLYIPSPAKIEAAVRAVDGEGATEWREIQPIVMPKWGLAMQEGMLAAWHVDGGRRRSPRARRSPTSRPRRSPTPSRARSPARCAGGWSATGETVPVGALLGVVADAVGRRTPRSTPSSTEFQDEFAAARRPRPTAERRPSPRSSRPAAAACATSSWATRAGAPVVFIHGFGGDLNNWLFNQPALAESRTTYALDLPGHGGSSKDVGDGRCRSAGRGRASTSWTRIEHRPRPTSSAIRWAAPSASTWP